MATVNKDFRVKDGLIVGNNLVVNGTTATIDGHEVVHANNIAQYAPEVSGTSSPLANTLVQRDENGGTSFDGTLNTNGISANSITASGVDSYTFTTHSTFRVLDNNDNTAGDLTLDPYGNLAIRSLDKDVAIWSGFGAAKVEGYSSATVSASGDVTLQSTNGNIVLSSGANTISASGATITNVSNPNANSDAANKGYVDTAISNLVDGAPAVLDTLAELANALGEDENFATTVTNQIASNKTISDAQYANALQYTDDQIDAYLNSTDGTTFVELTSYTDTAIATGSISATPTYEGVNLGFFNQVTSGGADVNQGTGYAEGVAVWNCGTYPAVKAVLKAKSNTSGDITASELLIAAKDGDFYITQYATVDTGNTLIADISVTASGNTATMDVSAIGADTVTAHLELLG